MTERRRALPKAQLHLHLDRAMSYAAAAALAPSLSLAEYRAEHPIDRLYRAGVHLSVSTDSPTITDVTLAREHERLRAAFGWTDAQLLACTRNAIEAAFVDEATRARLLAGLEPEAGCASSPRPPGAASSS